MSCVCPTLRRRQEEWQEEEVSTGTTIGCQSVCCSSVFVLFLCFFFFGSRYPSPGRIIAAISTRRLLRPTTVGCSTYFVAGAVQETQPRKLVQSGTNTPRYHCIGPKFHRTAATTVNQGPSFLPPSDQICRSKTDRSSSLFVSRDVAKESKPSM